MTSTCQELHELGLAAAARAIQNGEASSEAYVTALLARARALAGLNAFITIDEAAVVEAARDADRRRRAGRVTPLLGVPLAVKDSYLTKGLTTTVGTSVLAPFTPRSANELDALSTAAFYAMNSASLEQLFRDLPALIT